jgi:ADP-ribose pyrophosphatase YjhB (NUDIX family)
MPSSEPTKRPRVSARALIVRERKVLLSCYEDAVGPWYVLPGGGQRNRETLRTCLAREVKEEASVAVRVGRLRWVREFISANHPTATFDPDLHQVEITFECEQIDDGEAQLGEVPDEGQTGLCWIPIAELPVIRFFPTAVAAILNGTMEDRVYLGDV